MMKMTISRGWIMDYFERYVSCAISMASCHDLELENRDSCPTLKLQGESGTTTKLPVPNTFVSYQ